MPLLIKAWQYTSRRERSAKGMQLDYTLLAPDIPFTAIPIQLRVLLLSIGYNQRIPLTHLRKGRFGRQLIQALKQSQLVFLTGAVAWPVGFPL